MQVAIEPNKNPKNWAIGILVAKLSSLISTANYNGLWSIKNEQSTKLIRNEIGDRSFKSKGMKKNEVSKAIKAWNRNMDLIFTWELKENFSLKIVEMTTKVPIVKNI